MTVQEVAAIAGVTPAAVRMWVKRGHVKRTLSGHIDRASLVDWWDRRDHAQAATRMGRRAA